MKKKIDKNKLYLGIITFLVVFWTIASIFGFIGYGRSTKHHKASNVITANADTPTIQLPNDEIRSFTTSYSNTENLVVYHGQYISSSNPQDVVGLWEFYQYSDQGIVYPFTTNVINFTGTFVSNGITFDTIQLVGTSADGFYYTMKFLKNGLVLSNVYVSDRLDKWDSAYKLLTVVESNSDIYTFLSLNADFIETEDYLVVYDWAMLTGNQVISVNNGSLSFNSHNLTDMEGNIEQVNDYFTPFIFSDYQQYNIPTQIMIDESFELGFASPGINAVNQIDCEVFTDGNSVYLYYLLSCSWYESVLDTSPYDFQFAFTVYYDFTEYAVADAVGDAYVYFPTQNESVLFEEEQYFIQYYYEQTAYIADFVVLYDAAYINGFNAGLSNGGTADNNGFVNLISAVVDVPLRTFMSVFDMEILGVNLASFFLSLLSLCACIAIIRIIL